MPTTPRLWWANRRSLLRVPLWGMLVLALGACSTADWQARAVSVPATTDVGERGAAAYHRGKTHLVAGNFGLALEALRDAQRKDPDSVAVLNAIAITYGKLGRPRLARDYYERALAIEPGSAQTLNNYGRALLEERRSTDALRLLQRAAELAPDSPIVAANLAAARQHLDERQSMIAKAERTASTADQAVPAIWVERSSTRLQTLVSAPEHAAAGEVDVSIDPRVVHVVDAHRPSSRPESARGSPAEQQDRESARQAGPIEVSNGAGRRHMAARMRGYLSGHGITVHQLTNADSFAYRRSVIFYRPGFEAEASRLSSLLPGNVSIEQNAQQRSAVRLRLGADLLDFDTTLLRRS